MIGIHSEYTGHFLKEVPRPLLLPDSPIILAVKPPSISQRRRLI